MHSGRRPILSCRPTAKVWVSSLRFVLCKCCVMVGRDFFYININFVCFFSQLVDLRCGVRDINPDDHLTTELSIKEIETCQRISDGPTFIVSVTSNINTFLFSLCHLTPLGYQACFGSHLKSLSVMLYLCFALFVFVRLCSVISTAIAPSHTLYQKRSLSRWYQNSPKIQRV